MSSTVLFQGLSSPTTKNTTKSAEISRWTNQVLQALVTPFDNAVTFAHAKIMSMMVSELQLDEGIQTVSARFSEGFLSEEEVRRWRDGTAQSINLVTSPEYAEVTKDLLIAQLLNHELAPMSYDMDDNSTVIEFLNSSSRLVCVFDDEGLQLLWRSRTDSMSEFIKKEALRVSQIEQRIALILHTHETIH
jgi:hypothetical protein